VVEKQVGVCGLDCRQRSSDDVLCMKGLLVLCCRTMFSQYGAVKDARVIMEAAKGSSRRQVWGLNRAGAGISLHMRVISAGGGDVYLCKWLVRDGVRVIEWIVAGVWHPARRQINIATYRYLPDVMGTGEQGVRVRGV